MLGRWGGGVACMSVESTELCLGRDEEPAVILWVKIKGKAGTEDIMMWICCRPPDGRWCGWSSLQADRSSFTFASPDPYGGFQSPGLSVGGTNGRAQAIPNYMVFKGHSNNLTFCDSIVMIIIYQDPVHLRNHCNFQWGVL